MKTQTHTHSNTDAIAFKGDRCGSCRMWSGHLRKVHGFDLRLHVQMPLGKAANPLTIPDEVHGELHGCLRHGWVNMCVNG